MDKETAIAAFVGKKAGYYTEKWQQADDASPPALTGNIAAALGGIFWLAYRKLYVPLLGVAGVVVLDTSLTGYLGDSMLLPLHVIAAWDQFSTFVYAGVIGMLGNSWYWQKFRNTLAKARDASPDPALQEAYLRERGGTSALSAWGLLAVFVALISLLVLATGS